MENLTVLIREVKREAKKRKKENGTSYHKNLHEISRELGWYSWAYLKQGRKEKY